MTADRALAARNAGGHGAGRALAAVVLLLGAVLALVGTARAQEAGAVHLVEITGDIDLGLAPFLDRALREAEDAGAAAVVLRIDTPGGRLDAVLQMRDSLLASPVRTIAFVDQAAFSAGALVALASEEVHMAPGSVVGAATPVLGDTGVPADEKVISAVRTTFRATAEQRGRDPRVAEAMVDADVEIDGLVERGKLLTLTAPEAVEWGFADSIAADLDALLAAAGLDDRPVIAADPTLAERVVRFITNPVLASLLMLLGIWLIVGDLLSGGVGLGAAAGAAMMGVFFWGHLLAGLSGWEDVALVVLGLVLILIELVVIPGFGVPGILGLVALAGGTFLAMLNRDLEFVSGAQMLRTGAIVAVTFLALVAATVATLSYLSRRGGPEGVVLRTKLGAAAPVTERSGTGWLRWFGTGGVLASDRAVERQTGEPDVGAEAITGERAAAPAGSPGSLTGAIGVALSDLRPAGVAEIDGRRIDVVTEGEYLGAGDPVEVIHDEGYRRVVRRHRS